MVESFISEKFLAPMCSYYTPEATLVYAVILVAAVYGIYRFLERVKIKIDEKFFLAVLPFIIYGGTTRALRDHNFYQGYLFCSPLIYVVIFSIAFSLLILGLFIQRKTGVEYYKTMLVGGTVLVLYNVTMIHISNWWAFVLILSFTSFWAAVSFSIHKVIGKLNSGILSAHMLDASSSFVSVAFFGYCEQHVLTGMITGAYCSVLPFSMPFAPWLIFPLKLAVILPALLLIDRYSENKNQANFLKLIVLILGLALGTRNALTVSMSAIHSG
ncbi:MAG: DUF63 family protein [Candidatus Micrarchaeota archaeon]|nr:DUF63 family protein [Candidatus Micrarchaeota archaeon]